MQHRYYGKSFPFGGNEEDANANSSTLGYLSSTQALADYATLIIDLKKNLSATDSPVIVIGGSYGGSILYTPYTAIYILSKLNVFLFLFLYMTMSTSFNTQELNPIHP